MSRPLLDTPDVYRALSDPTRRGVLDMLTHRDHNVSEMASKFAMSLPAFSRHLRVLRQAGLVAERSDGRRRVYHLNPAPLRDVSEWLAAYKRFWKGRLRQLDQHLKEKP